MKEEWWLTAAVSDDRLVAELLVRLKDSAVTAFVNPLPPSTWGARQPRSSVEKKRDARRRSSPTTPLSWSAAASPSDFYDDSSTDPSPPSDRLRSKISASAESPTASSKRHPKKKTFEELKDEESSLLKERTHLKKELAALQLTFVEQRSINDDLKRRKLDLPVESGTNSEANSVEPKEQNTNRNAASEATSSNVSRQVKLEETSEEPPSCSSHQRGGTSQVPIFVLPDLNIIPDEDCDPEGIVGMS